MSTKTTLENVQVYSGDTPISVTFPLGSLADFFCIYAEKEGKWRMLLAYNQQETGDKIFSKPGVSGWIVRSQKGVSSITYYVPNQPPRTDYISGTVQMGF
jgi:hypothetical protein